MNTGKNPRGFILPVVLIAVALTTAVGGALVTASFHATRGARTAWHGDRALHAADVALATASQSTSPAHIAHLAIGQRETSTTTIDDIDVALSTTRTSPSTVLLHAVATTTSGPTTTARRELSRVLHLDASAIPIRSALAIYGTVDGAPELQAAGNHTGAETSCGIDTDTSSTTALLTPPPIIIDTTAFTGAPTIRLLHADSATAFRTALWNRITQLHPTPESVFSTTTIGPDATGTTCTSNSGEPRRSVTAVAPCITRWPVRRLASHSGIVTLATSRHQGALVIDGDLHVTGHVEVRGLLIVQGTVDTRNGSLDATGAIIATHHAGGTSHLGNNTIVRWSRCSVLRAVTPLATSGSPPVLTWAQRW